VFPFSDAFCVCLCAQELIKSKMRRCCADGCYSQTLLDVSTLHHITVQYIHITVQYSTVQYSTLHHITAQYSTSKRSCPIT